MAIKICFSTIEYPPDIGGVSKSAKRVSEMLSQSGFQVHVFAPAFPLSESSQQVQCYEENGIYIYRIKQGRSQIEKAIYDIIKDVDKFENFDIFHGFFLFKALSCIKVAQRGSRPVIASFRGIDADWMISSQYYRLAKQVLTESSWITSVSTESLRKANTISDISEKSSFIFNSIEVKSRKAWRLTDKNRNIIGTASTFRVKKNIPLLLDAYSLLTDNIRRELLLVGDFIENKEINSLRRESFEKMCSILGVSKEVKITGYLPHEKIQRTLLNMNVFVLSSDHEGLPNAVLEAAALGLPIVSTNVDGIKDIFSNNESALLVPPGNAIALSKSIQDIITNETLATSLSLGAKKIASSLNSKAEKKLWQEVYSKLC